METQHVRASTGTSTSTSTSTAGKVDEECERLLRALAPRLSELIRRKRKWKLEINAAGNAPFAVVVTEYDSV